MVISTKYSAPYTKDRDEPGARISYLGNGKRSLHLSVRDSLQRLKCDWIDILYVHWWDYSTSIEEVVDSVHALVQSGKVLYLGVSNTPAWIVSAANTYARDHGKTQFSVYQGQWNLMGMFEVQCSATETAANTPYQLVTWKERFCPCADSLAWL